jgi:predicted metalloprotease
MDLDELRESQNVEDRRGRGGFGGYGPHIAVGGGGLGLVGVLVISLLFGVNPVDLLSGVEDGGYSQGAPSGPRTDDAAFAFARKIVGSDEDVWRPLLEARGAQFSPATFTVYDRATPTGCGTGQSSAGPFYCPSDAHIYLDLSFFNELESRFGAPGDFARAYVISHEYGHHIQNLLGAMNQHDTADRGASGDSVRMELQADCYAGVWAYHANQQFQILQDGDVESGLAAASSVGDDTLQQEGQGYVVPDSFTHGTSDQRMRWFKRGLANGDIAACDTFSARQL